MSLLRRFALVGTIATTVDVALLLVLVDLAGWRVWWADAVAVATATAVSWVLHRVVSVPGEPARAWIRRTGPYLVTAVGAMVLDVAVISVLAAWLDPRWWAAVLVIKVPALLVAFLYRMAGYRDTMFIEIRDAQSEPEMRPTPPGTHRLAVVVPAYREQDRIGHTVAEIRTALGDLDLQIVVVDDGSNDGTAEAAERAGADLVIRSYPNRGKGAAVRAGILAADARTVAFTDADLSYSPGQIRTLMERVEQGWDVVVGSRQHVATTTVVRAGRLREVGGRIINMLTAVVLLGRYRDTQCGLKAMRSDVGRVIFSHSHIDGFAFDVEVFHLVERHGFTLVEVPVEVVNSTRSTVSVVRDAARLVRDLFRIRRRGRLGYYEVDLDTIEQLRRTPGPDGDRGSASDESLG